MGGGVPGAQAAPQSAGNDISTQVMPQSGGNNVGTQAMPQSGTGKYGGMANQGGGANPFQQFQQQQQFQGGQGIQQMPSSNAYYPQPQTPQTTGKYGGMAQQPFQQANQQQPFQQQGGQPNYSALLRSIAGMFGQQGGAPVSNYNPVQSANDFQLRNTYQFNPATDPSRILADRMWAENHQRELDEKAAREARAARGESYGYGMGDSTGGAGGSGGGGGGADGEAGGPGGDSGTGGDAGGQGGLSRGGHVNPDKKIRAALLTAKGVQAKAVPARFSNGGGAEPSKPLEAATLHRGLDPSSLIFREPVQNRLAEVANMFPEKNGYPPIVAAKTGNGLLILDGHNRAKVAHQRNEKIDAVVVPESVYRQALSKGLDEVDVSHAALERAGQGDAASAIRQQFRGINWEKSEADAQKIFDEYEDAPHGMDNVHTVIDPATVDHPAADIPGIHLRAGRMGKAGGGDVDYRGEHTAPGPESGAPLHDLSGVYPDDFYSSNGFRYYADMGEPHDRHSYNQAIRTRGNPEAPVWIYRAVPANVYKKELKYGNVLSLLGKGDWVTTSKQYAIVHGEHSLGGKGKYNVVGKRVKAKDIYTSGDSIHEWGYHPQKSSDDAPGKSGGGALAAPGAPAPEEEDSITAYHGSPYDFEQFDPAHIGKGEGNQSFGHGLYFAADEGIAKGYRDTLAHKGTIDLEHEANVRGLPISRESQIEIRRMSKALEHDPQTAALWAQNANRELRSADQEKIANLIKAYRDSSRGHMYEVRLKAKPEHFLDYDKPLSEQSEHVQSALRSLFQPHNFEKDPFGREKTGGDLVPKGKFSADKFAAAGIRGIRYLDAGSRSQGDGTHNYVVFDPKHIEVARKYERGGEINAPALSSRVTDRRIPELQNAADMVAAGQMGPEEYHAQVGNLKPVRPYTSLPPMATREDLLRGLSKDKHGKIGAEEAIPEGHAVGLRLDIPAYNKHGVWAPTIHEGHEKNSKPIAHAPFAHVSNPVFSVDAGKALGVARGNEKAPFAKINGFWKKTSPEDAQAMAQEYLNHPEWRQVGMDPERHSFFYDRETRQPVASADEALQIGPLVLAKNPKYGSLKDFQYEQGGRVGYAGGGADVGELEALKNEWDTKNIDHSISSGYVSRPDLITLSKIVVPKESRGAGLGSEAMRQLTALADKHGKTISLTPDTNFGASSVQRLKDFYKSHGFVENRGRNKDFSISESMYRAPSKNTSAKSGGGRIGYGAGGGEDDPTVRHALSLTKGMN